ncbi:MAG: hypothetical protein ACJASP_002454, partial [Roseivirga sp.]
STTLTDKFSNTEDHELASILSMALNRVVDFERQTNDLLKMYLNQKSQLSLALIIKWSIPLRSLGANR